jgi:hypothetical protein
MVIVNFLQNCSNSTQSVFVQCLNHLDILALFLIQCEETLIIFQNLAEVIYGLSRAFPDYCNCSKVCNNNSNTQCVSERFSL